MAKAYNVRFELEATCPNCNEDMGYFQNQGDPLKAGDTVCGNCAAPVEIDVDDVSEARKLA